MINTKTNRLNYLDNLMIFLSVLVVLHHVAVGYGTMGGWCYVTSQKLTGTIQIILSALFGIEASFSMSLFFFVSAFLTIPSLEKKGAAKYLSSRLFRLLIPLLFVMIIFAPSILFFIELYNHSTQLSWSEYVLKQNTNSPNTSHTWFILVLIIFELFYLAYWKYLRPYFSISRHFSSSVPSHTSIAVVIVLCSILTNLVRLFYPIGENFIGLQFANFVPYVLMYALGILVRRKHWLELLSHKVAKTWFLFSLISAGLFSLVIYLVINDPPLINKFLTGLTWESLFLAFIETTLVIGFSGFLLHFFRIYLDQSNFLLSKMRENRYGVYIFHSGIVVSITILLESVPIIPTVKFIVACVFSIIFSYVFVGIIRKFPIVKKII